MAHVTRTTAATRSGDGRDGTARQSSASAALGRRMQLALGALRGVTLAWAAVVCGVDAGSGVLDRPTAAFALLTVLAVWSAAWTIGVTRRSGWVDGWVGVTIDLTLAATTVAADRFLYDGGHPQSFGSAWPLLAVVATGVAVGPVVGLTGGLAVGGANLAATAAVGIDGEWLSTLGTLVLLAAAGWVSGWVADRLRTTAQEVSDAQARAEVARTLHDGVLQTLAVIQRRSTDDELVALAREQDGELRTFLRGERPPPTPDATTDEGLVERLRSELVRLGNVQSITAHLVVIDPGSAVGGAATALVGATCEAVVNAAKHAGVEEVWVSVDRRDPSGTMVVVHDEGRGFDPITTPLGTGITSSIHERLAVAGGGATIDSRTGRGTDVTVWVP